MFHQTTLFDAGPPAVRVPAPAIARRALDDRSWTEHGDGWLDGSETLLEQLAATLPWRQRRVTMWGQVVDEPRLTAWWRRGHGPLPHDALAEIGVELRRRYQVEFDSIGFNLYRDGDDSVTWHGDTKGPYRAETVIAIVSLGTRRPFRLRPRGGGESLTFLLGQGDLFVMGGATQHRWEHAVPKCRRVHGMRMSVTFRHGGVS